MKQYPSRVIIIGAGLSGLTAAQEILKSIPNQKVTVLQAMDQVGGRTRSVNINGAIYDLGAEWIGPPQKYAIQLAHRSGNQLSDQFHSGKKILQFGKQKQEYKSNIPQDVGLIPLIHMQFCIWKLQRMAKKVPKQNPAQCVYAHIWDSMTLHTWITQNVWFQKIKKLFQISVRAVIGCETNQISFLFFLWYAHQNHGFESLINIENGLQQKKTKFGTQHMSFYLQKQIQKRKGAIILNQFVSKVTQNQKQCIIQTRTGEQYIADYIIFAGPPSSVNKIQFYPQLSRERRFITSRYIMGAYSKMVLLYEKRYWKDKGYSGQILSDCVDSPVFMVYDDTRTKDNGEQQPGLVIFFAGAIDQQWTGDKQMCKKIVTQKLSSHYKLAQLLVPIAYDLKVWNSEQSIGGAPTAYLPPGALTKIKNLKQTEGRIHWAGTQLANISQGYMDGAIQSGIRVSQQIIARIKNPSHDKQLLKQKKYQPSGKSYSKIIGAKSKWLEWL